MSPVRPLPVVLLLLAVCAAAFVGTAAAQPPNVLIIVTDDQRASGTMGVMPKTRHYFADGGVQYTNAFATTPLCCPSRSTILTGRYAHNTDVRSNFAVRDFDTTTMFPRLLQQAGYRTAMVGKLLNHWPRATTPPYFDRWALGGGPYARPRFNVNGDLKTVHGYSTRLMGAFATRFVRQFETEDAAPWLLYVAPLAPHYPWRPDGRYRDAPVPGWRGNPAVFERDRSDKPPYVRTVDYTVQDGRSVRKDQLRTLMSVDDMTEEIFTTLRDLGEARNTLAFFLSDNGLVWADHHLGGAKATAGEKRVPYTPSVRVPFFLRWPGHVRAGARDPRLTGTVDIAPTVLDAAGITPDPTKPPLDGRSLVEPNVRNRILLEYWMEESWILTWPPFPTWASIRTSKYQYIENYADDDESAPTFVEYYDLVHDPFQLHNLLDDGDRGNDPDVAELSSLLARDRVCAGTTGKTGCP